MIVGLGVDVCDVERIRRALEGRTGERFRERVFTPGERAYCEARGRGRFASYAARFAAKEAGMKALGTGWGEGVSWHDFEVVRAASGPPLLVVHGEAAVRARARRIGRWLLALSHAGGQAIASVVAESGGSLRRRGAAGGRGGRAAAARSVRPRPKGRR
jgi:holo-[acyl-carrier protein] synthase